MKKAECTICYNMILKKHIEERLEEHSLKVQIVAVPIGDND